MSTKHLLTTISEKIEFNDIFYKFFALTAGEITPLLNNSEIDNLDDWAIWLDPNNIYRTDELDNDSSFNTYIKDGFLIYNMVTKEGFEVKSDSREWYLTEDSIDLMKKGKGFIKFKDMEEEMTLFVTSIMNNELTKPLYELMDLLNTSRKDKSMTYNDMAIRFTHLLLEANIKAMALSGELIINRLLRCDPDEDFSRPDFSGERGDVPDYQIYTILKALENNKSVLIGLSSQDIKRQLLSDDLITKKTGASYLDPFFMKHTNTKRLKEIHKIIKNKKK